MSNGIDQFVFVVLLWNKKSAENWETMSVSDYSLGTMVICDFFIENNSVQWLVVENIGD